MEKIAKKELPLFLEENKSGIEKLRPLLIGKSINHDVLNKLNRYHYIILKMIIYR